MIRALLSTVLTLALAAPTIWAAPSAREVAEAGRRFKRGNQLYADGQYEEALRLYVAAYELLPSLDILFNLALAREKILDHEGCAVAFRQYLEQAKGDDPLVDRASTGLERCQARTRIPVKISSIPAGAAISVGQGTQAVFRGRTPRDLQLAPGIYAISVSLPGHAAMSQEVVVSLGKRPEVDFPLERLSSLSIEADVSGASVAIDDGEPEPAPVKREVRAGTYRVVVARPGYETVKREVAVGPGEQSTLMVSLPKRAPARRVRIVSNHGDTRVAIDGTRTTAAPLTRRLVAGKRTVRAEAPGRIPFAGSIEVPENRDIVVRLDLARPRTRRERALVLGLAGASVLAAAGAIVSGSMALSAQSEFDNVPSADTGTRGERHARRADWLWGTSLVLGLAAGYAHYATGRSSSVEVK